MRTNIIPTLSAMFLATISSLSIAGSGGPPSPTVSAEKVRITYTSDIKIGAKLPVPAIRLLESIQITPASDETNVSSYNVYWGDILKNKLGLALAPRLAKIPATGNGDILNYEFPDNFKMEIGAKWILVCTENNGKEFCGKAGNMELVWDDLLATSCAADKLKSAVKDNTEESCPGLEVMETCGDSVCNGIETTNNCPSDCADYKMASFNYQTICDEIQKVYHPKSIKEIQKIIAEANANNMHVKVVAGAGPKGTTGSASGIVCSDGILIVVDFFNEKNFAITLETFEGYDVVSVPAATRMNDLGAWLHKHDKQMGFVHLGWADATIAGAIGTSAHGSSPKHTNVVANEIISMDIINPKGELMAYSRGTTGASNPDLWAAMLTNLGYLGVITNVRVLVEEAQNIHVKTTFHTTAELFDNVNKNVFNDIKECDYGQYNWFPSLGQYMKWCGKLTDKVAEAGATNTLLAPYGAVGESPLQPTAKDIFQGYQVGACFPDSDITLTAGKLRADGLHLTPAMLKNRKGFSKKVYTGDAIGPVYSMTSSHLVDAGRDVFQMDWEVAVPHKHMQAALAYVNQFALGMNDKNRVMPMPLVGIFVRFSISEDKSLLAYTSTGGEFEEGTAAVHIEMPIYVPVGMDEERFQNYISPYEAVMKTLIHDYGARAHWGKNQYYFSGKSNSSIFSLQRDLNVYGDRLDRFNNAIAIFDPKGMFANRQAKVIGIEYPAFEYPPNW